MAEVVLFLGIFRLFAFSIFLDIEPWDAFPLVVWEFFFEDGVGILDGAREGSAAWDFEPGMGGDGDEFEAVGDFGVLGLGAACDAVVCRAIGLREDGAGISDEVSEGAIGVGTEADAELSACDIAIAARVIFVPEFWDFGHGGRGMEGANDTEDREGRKGLNKIVHGR